MPVDTKHAQYLANEARWKRNRDVTEGEEAVKAAGETYLPKLSGHNDTEYEAYKTRAAFFNATGRTVDGLTGLIFRKPPTHEYPAAMEPLVEDVTMAGLSLDELAQKIVEDAVVVGRGGILVEYPPTDLRERTVPEVEAEGLRPYLTYWTAESILDWRLGRVNNHTVLTMVKLSESVEEPDPTDPWKTKAVEQVRVLRLVEGVYTVELYRKIQGVSKSTAEWTLVSGPSTVIIRGQPVAGIPFIFVGPRDSTPEVQKAPISDLVLTNLSHYRTSADYENGLHWTGVPTPVFIGALQGGDGQEVTTVRLGSTSGITMAAGSDAKFLEFEGSGLEGGLGKALTRKEEYMAVLGARLLAADKRQVEAAETAEIHRAGENSVLSSIASSVSKSITRALSIMAEWAGLAGDVSFTLNQDYTPKAMDAQTLTAVLAAWQQGALSMPELYELFKAGELVRTDKPIEEHEAEVEAESAGREDAAGASLLAAASALRATATQPGGAAA